MSRRVIAGILAWGVLTAFAVSDPPPDLSVHGEWWSARPAERLSIRKDGVAVRLRSLGWVETTGTWTENGEQVILEFPDAKDEKSLTLKKNWGKDEARLERSDENVTFVRADVATKELELARTYRVCHELEKLAKSESNVEKYEEFLERIDAAEQGFEYLPLLAGKERPARQALLLRVLTAHAPELAVDLEKEIRGSSDLSCSNSLKQLGVYIVLYEAKAGKYPARLDELKRPDLAVDDTLFWCPAHGKDHPYVYVFPDKGVETADGAIMIHCAAAHADGRRRVLTFLGQSWVLREADLPAALKAGSIAGYVPIIDDVDIRVEKDGKDTVLRVNLKASDLRGDGKDGSGKIRVSVKLKLSPEHGPDRDSEIFTEEGEATGGALELDFKWRVPRFLVEDPYSVFIALTDDVTGANNSFWVHRK